jgi:hypothetical protein
MRARVNHAVRLSYIPRNPVSGIKFLPEGPGRMRIVSHEEQQKYLAAAGPLLCDVATMISEMGGTVRLDGKSV